jgi:hypothetical protein
MEGQRLEDLQLPQMLEKNEDAKCTAFTVSTDYRHGTSTGISAADRAATIRGAPPAPPTLADSQPLLEPLPLQQTCVRVPTRLRGCMKVHALACVIIGRDPALRPARAPVHG